MPRQGLSRAHVVAEAALLADEIGLEKLTLAAVATRLGVRLPSLYNHVEGLEGLRRDLALLAVRELVARGQAAAVGLAGRDALFGIASAYRAFGHERPALFAATMRAPDPADTDLVEAAEQALRVIFAALAGYGLSGDDAVDATRGLRALLLGWVTLESSGGFGLPRDVDRSFRRLLEGFDTSLRSRSATQDLMT